MWKSIFRYVLNTNKNWQKFYEEQGILIDKIDSIDDFNQLPILKKSELPKRQRENLPFAGFAQDVKVSRIFVSPGPIYDPQGNKEDFWNFSPLLIMIGVKEGDILQNTFTYHLSPLGFMLDSAALALGAKVIPAGTGNSEIQVEIMKDIKTSVITGTPSFVMYLIQLAEQKGYQLGKELAVSKALFTAEKLTDEMKHFFAQRNIDYIEAYGTADLGCIAYRKKGEQSFTLLDHLFVQICDPVSGQEVEEGEMGEIVISMASDVYPLLRFGTGDLSRWVKYQRQIEGLLGRVGDSYKVKGMFVHAHQLSEVIKEIPEITYYQAIIDHVDGKDNFVIKVEADRKAVEAREADAANEADQATDIMQATEVEDVHVLLEMWAQEIQNWIRVRPKLELVESNSISREEKQLVDIRS